MMKRRRAMPQLGVEPATRLDRAWLYGVAPDSAGEHGDRSAASSSAPSSSSQASSASQGKGANGARQHTIAHLLASPIGELGQGIEPQHQVMQVCLGAEHGLLLTDSAIIFTWGDNRYGQLGRTACLIEEDGKPFPIIHMVSEEVIQIAAGRHHSLALSIQGMVWAWGRNKAGQLGCGDFRDRVVPEEVRHEPDEDHKKGAQLGQRTGERITGISAGGNSSVACGFNSSIWQWGEITTAWAETTARTPNITADESEEAFRMDRPYCVFKRASYRTRMRRGKAALSETARLVFGKDENVGLLKDRVQEVRHHQIDIAERRQVLWRMEHERKKKQERQKKGDTGKEIVEDMSDTLAVLEQEISGMESDIFNVQKNLESCAFQQARYREQLQQVSEQAADLSAREDDISLKLIDTPKGSADWRDLQEKLQEVKEYIQASQNSRMTILDQRAQMDKEKQRLTRSRDEHLKTKRELQERQKLMKELMEASIQKHETSDSILKFLSERHKDYAHHFDGKAEEVEFVAAMQEYELDKNFLREVEDKSKLFLDMERRQGSLVAAMRAKCVVDLLQDLLDMRTRWIELLSNRWVRPDLDCGVFFAHAEKPHKNSSLLSALQDAAELSALPWEQPQIMDGKT